MFEKLNMQAVLSASANETEYVRDSLVTFEKVRINLCFHFFGTELLTLILANIL